MNITHLIALISAASHRLAASNTEEVDAATTVIFAEYRCSSELSIFINQIRKSNTAPVSAGAKLDGSVRSCGRAVANLLWLQSQKLFKIVRPLSVPFPSDRMVS